VKFDYVVGNPPYQDSSHKEKKNTLWRKFVDKSLEIVKDGGYILFVIPSSWMGSKKLLDKYFLPYNLIFVNKDECRKYFKVGSTFSYYLLQKQPYDGITTIVNKEISGDILKTKININDYIFDCFPRNISRLSNSIISKVLNYEEKLGIINSTTHHNVHRDRWRTEPSGDFRFPVYNTPSKIYYYNSPHKHQDMPKIIIPTTTYFRKMLYTTYGTTQSFCYYLLKDNEDPEVVLNNINNILFDYINECFRYANWNNVQLLKKMPKIPLDIKMDDNDVFDFFKITKEESKYIKGHITWR